jgi:hypothetical protein
MALDQHRPGPDPAESINPPDQRPALAVDADALTSVSRLLAGLPGPQGPHPAPPSAEAIGHPGLARDIAAFDQRYRAVAVALATDDDTASAHLARAAVTYTRTENEASARLAELGGARPPLDHSTDPDADLRQV